MHFENNNKVINYEVISQIPNLNELVLCGKKISNLSWLAYAINLRYVRFNIQLENGDLQFLKEMPKLQYLFFADKKNFSLKLEEMTAFLAGKGFNQEALKSKHLSLDFLLS